MSFLEKISNRIRSFKVLRETLLVLIVFSIVLTPFRGLDKVNFHMDENYWMRTSKYFKLFFIDKDFNSPQWKKFVAYENPPVGRYIIGAILYSLGYKNIPGELSNTKAWDCSKNYKWNLAHGGVMPPAEMLYAVRLTMAITGILTCLLLYLVMRSIFDIKTGIITAALLAWNPLMASCSKRAMVDAPLLFFLTLNLALSIFFYRAFLKQRFGKTIMLAVLIGINIALAAGTKPNGALAGITFMLFAMLIALVKIWEYRICEASFRGLLKRIRASEEIRIIIISVVIVAAVSSFVFVILNPYLYRHPGQGFFNIIKTSIDTIVYQKAHFPQGALNSLGEKGLFVARRTLFPNSYATLGNIFKIPLDLVFFIIGLAMLLEAEIRHMRAHKQPSLKSLILIWTVVTFVGITLWIPIDWNRYYLPIAECVAAVTGYGLATLINKGRFLTQSKSVPI